MNQRRTVIRAAVFFVLVAASVESARALDAPSGPPVLRISGKLGVRNVADTAAFDLAMLEKMPQTTFTTRTPWDSQPVKFSGPLMRDVLKAVQANGAQITAIAVNDYKVTIPVEDARRFNLVLALRMNDRPIPPRTKGPLFVVYPFDSDPALKDKSYQDRSIWQVKAMEIN